MTDILYATGNKMKLRVATEVCRQFDISFSPIHVDAHEIQAETGEPVALDKAVKAFENVQKPLVISDDSWMIPGLNNFPGPYMKSINHWFSHEDWLRLTTSLKDRRIILRQIVVYQDENVQKLFYTDIEGLLLTKVQDTAEYAHMSITSFDGGATSIAENVNNGRSAIFDSKMRTSWHDFAEWYTTAHMDGHARKP